MDKIKKFIECLVPVTACNLKCEYCYVMQEKRRENRLPVFNYTPEHIAKALSKERLGGIAYISICGAGETLLPKEMPAIIHEILKQGHYINITTNGTLTNRFEEILQMPKELLTRLHFAFSLHYIELQRTNNLNNFFTNVKMVKNAGCSFLVQLNLYDNYNPYIEGIKELCRKEVGAYPQIVATRKEDISEKKREFEFYTDLTKEEYINKGKEFASPLFDFTTKNFNVKRKEFCYAGAWSFILNLQTGDIKRCYAEPEEQNIYENLNDPIKLKAIGRNCKCEYCINSSHFMSLGIIPDIKTPTYAALRNREEANWYNEEMKFLLNSKLEESNKKYSKIKQIKSNVEYKTDTIIRKIRNRLRKVKNGK